MRHSYIFFYLFTRVFYIVPFWLLYFFSDLIFLLFYYLIPYRKKVITQNIARSFPNEDKKRLNQIRRTFYRHFSDLIVEGIKGFTISRHQLLKRYKFINPEVMNNYFDEGIDVISVGAHYANWEWGILAAPLQLKHSLIAFYTRLSNPYMDSFMKSNRKKWGTELVATHEFRKAFQKEKLHPTSYFFGADVSPPNPKTAHWMTFLNQDTACMKGAEFFARRNRLPVIYFDVQRVKRGHYTVELSVLEHDSFKTSSGEITEKYMKKLENIILKKPEDYLWSHRRWKHTREQPKVT